MKKNIILTLLASAVCVLFAANYHIYFISESSTEVKIQEIQKSVVVPKKDDGQKTYVSSIDATQLSSDDAVQNALKNAQIAANELRRLENRKRHLEKINADKKAKKDYYRSFAKAYETDIYDQIPYDESVFLNHEFDGGPQISESGFENIVIINSPISAQDFKDMVEHVFIKVDGGKPNNEFSIVLPYYKFGGEYTSLTASNCNIVNRSPPIICDVGNGSLRIFEDKSTPELDYIIRVGEDYYENSTGRPETIYLFKDNQILMFNKLDDEFKRRVPERHELSDDMDY